MLFYQTLMWVGLLPTLAPEPLRPPPHLLGGTMAANIRTEPEPEAFIDAIDFQGRVAIMSTTLTILDGKRTPWHDIPDEPHAQLVEVHIDLKRKVVLRIVYRTRKDI